MDEFLNRMNLLLNDSFNDFLKFYNDEKNYRGLRANTLKCSFEKLESLLDFQLEKTPFCTEGAYIPQKIVSLGNNPLHHAGAFYIQEPSATSAVTMLDVKQGDKVLDLCAAPGGKSTQIASALNSKGLLWSNEIVRGRANILLSNIERMGVKNAVVSSCHPDVLCKKLSEFFDKILVDAPCSGEGMFKKNQAREEWSVEHVKSCAQRQLQILNSAKYALKDGGVIVYSTCTFSHEENEGVIESFLKENPNFILEDSGVSFGRKTLDYAVRIFPMDGGEGHFAARLRKTGEAVSVSSSYNKNEKPKTEITDFINSITKSSPFSNNIQIIGQNIYAMPEDIPDCKGLSVIRGGVLLGELKKNRIEPAHHMFMCLKPEECINSVNFDVNDTTIKKFLHGEEIPVNNSIKGYTAVCVNNIVTGFGKASNGSLKNKYPKGLRIL